jgi:ribose transport system permease protein
METGHEKVVTRLMRDRLGFVGGILRFYIQHIGIITLPIFFLIVFFTILQPRFASFDNFFTTVRQGSFLGIVACGAMIVVISRGFDLSIGSAVSLAGVVSTSLSFHLPLPLAYLSGVLIGSVVGLINGVVVAYVGVPSFIVTLSMMSIASGVALTITGGQTVFGMPPEYATLGAGYLLNVPIPIIVAGMVFFLTWLFLAKTRWGRNIYAMGGNPNAARLSGIDIKKHHVLAFTISGLLSGICGVVLSSRANSGPPTLGAQLTLTSVAAICIGGVSLFGGSGKVSGAIWGVFLLALLSNGFDLINVSSYNQMIIIGTIIIIAVTFNAYQKK